MFSSSITSSATLVAVAENSAWYRIRVPSQILMTSSTSSTAPLLLHYEPVITSWVISHQKTGQKITDGSIDQKEIQENMINLSSSSSSSSSDNSSSSSYFEWTTQVFGLQSNGSYVVNFEVLACCTKVEQNSDQNQNQNQNNDDDGNNSSFSSSSLIGETKRFILDACTFSTLRQPVVLRCVWRQCQSAVVYVTRQFPGRIWWTLVWGRRLPAGTQVDHVCPGPVWSFLLWSHMLRRF